MSFKRGITIFAWLCASSLSLIFTSCQKTETPKERLLKERQEAKYSKAKEKSKKNKEKERQKRLKEKDKKRSEKEKRKQDRAKRKHERAYQAQLDRKQTLSKRETKRRKKAQAFELEERQDAVDPIWAKGLTREDKMNFSMKKKKRHTAYQYGTSPKSSSGKCQYRSRSPKYRSYGSTSNDNSYSCCQCCDWGCQGYCSCCSSECSFGCCAVDCCCCSYSGSSNQGYSQQGRYGRRYGSSCCSNQYDCCSYNCGYCGYDCCCSYDMCDNNPCTQNYCEGYTCCSYQKSSQPQRNARSRGRGYSNSRQKSRSGSSSTKYRSRSRQYSKP